MIFKIFIIFLLVALLLGIKTVRNNESVLDNAYYNSLINAGFETFYLVDLAGWRERAAAEGQEVV